MKSTLSLGIACAWLLALSQENNVCGASFSNELLKTCVSTGIQLGSKLPPSRKLTGIGVKLRGTDLVRVSLFYHYEESRNFFVFYLGAL